ncbi:MAG: hypothetical protein JXR22_01110, partial [Prolixibacteraceae bacterium]|nr:hypothetical protein [Prolixibacteraceae bacterium]
LTDRYGFASSQFVDSDSTIIASFLLETVPRSLNLKVKNEQHFRLEGLLFDPLHGVVVDHVPFRGKLNVKMKEYDSKQFLLQCQLLQPAMVVLQYGLNVVPDVRLEYGNYRIALQQDLQLLKKYLPNASFLVMGVPDMARKEAGIMVSYPNITAVIEAQREAAMREKVAFWNFRKAMGGEGAMVKWVDDGLGRSDYAHLTAAGAEKAATIFVNDLMQVISTLPADD